MNAGRVPVLLRYIGKPALCRDATGESAFTGAPPGHYRRRPESNRVVAVALPGSDAGMATVSAGGVTVYRGAFGGFWDVFLELLECI
ncbi:hypothetical protein DPMN_177777 [Dreissena polymorpha]|uniref:Uncharacterized protein n=1 Tax=Dreissena polymorpha TaxID=45954 RepID=A0A9D4CIM3_DREPO|nr:hypothetical protein DPMN_051873 [Dreissena polymorpha]KAH3770598.1 hypothetical protein DPMN_171887 [Dreissena polymorpha]KAH3776355.1 hypothetical protein DPMN_177777 [Dreissena polymorpha]